MYWFRDGCDETLKFWWLSVRFWNGGEGEEGEEGGPLASKSVAFTAFSFAPLCHCRCNATLQLLHISFPLFIQSLSYVQNFDVH